MNEFIEAEVKFHLTDPQKLRDGLVACGAEFLGRAFETNAIWDNEQDEMAARGGLLRLRRDGSCRLTAKLPPENADADFKVSREWEVTVSDFTAMEAILRALGFSPKRRYEKERETWLIGKVHVTLDRMPFGWFAELEGERDEIRSLAARLGFSWERRIILTYMRMFEIIRSGEGLSATEPTFDLMKGVSVPIERYLPAFEAGA
ncbi:MAG: class IV adenylate cyclase [Deltaproteobacteria bacterium]|nr:class IV adenylate cyclase [Deltaproteobacteria bacterium]